MSADLGQARPAEEDGERVSAAVALVHLQNLHRVVLQVIVEHIRPPVAVERLPIVPDAVEAQDLCGQAGVFQRPVPGL